ncbi:MAG TPA: cation diffusion facilitator family transporter [Pseudomonadales bacterium]|nr:cation diffusion facilitator family transporter [Pseudomonadales bacterium]
MSAQGDSLKSILLALGANAAIAVSKFVAAWITQSGSMLAEAVHSASDCGNQILLLWGMKVAKRPATADHPLGYGKEVYFWSFIVAIMLFSMGGLFSIYEGWHKLHNPEPLENPLVAIGVLIFGIVAEGFSLWGCVQEINKARGGRPFSRWFVETRQSELIVVFGEDIAAMFGLTLALAAIGATLITHNPMYDALGSIGIGLLLVLVAVFVGREVKALLIGQSVEAEVRETIQKTILGFPTVRQIFNMITLQMGNEIMVAVKAEIYAEGAAETAQAINAIEQAIKQAVPSVSWVFFEPDIED